jgi:putative transposase
MSNPRATETRWHRRSVRLKPYDYSQPGAYFLTMVAQGRECLFGAIVDGEMHLNAAGEMATRIWRDLPTRFPFVRLDAFVVMPNHVHGVIVLRDGDMRSTGRGDPCDRPFDIHRRRRGESRIRPYSGDRDRPRGTLPGTLGRVVQAFKSVTTHEYTVGVKQQGWPPFPGRLWQRNYYEHIVRSEDDLRRIRQYIADNAQCWPLDAENPSHVLKGR